MKFEINVNNIILIVMGLLTLINLILLIINNIKVKKYKVQYDKTLAKFNSTENIKDEFESLYDRLNEVEKASSEMVECVNNFSEKIKANIQKIGLVKYNAYDDTENKLSFALVLLDDRDNGVLINHVYSKHGSNSYGKLVVNGKIEERICEEEAEALRIAKEDKDFKERKVAEVNKATNKKKVK